MHELNSEMTVNGVSPNVITYNMLIYGFCIIGQLEEAIGFLNEMVVENINPHDLVGGLVH